MKKTKLAIVLCVILLALAVSACGGPEGVVSSSTGKNSESTTGDKKTYDGDTDEILPQDTPIDPLPGGGGGN